ncbi:hypothetical protein PI125_g26935 [Phytophthora idaei]|nr:hypothetical protein PI125_g26935 [Phytophthora idaei]
MLMSAPVSWGSKKQSSVSLSTSEAEYIALSLAIQEGKWIHRLLCEILVATNDTGPELKIREDNQSCIKMTKNPVNHGRTKHIDIKYHHIRDEVKRGEVKLEYCETSAMLADIMTKALPGPRHTDLTAALGIHACSHSGGVLRVAGFGYCVPVIPINRLTRTGPIRSRDDYGTLFTPPMIRRVG